MKTLEQLARESGIDRSLAGHFVAEPEELARFRAACRAEALEEAAQWQPIETAPDEVDFHALVASPIESGGLFVEEAWWCHERREWWPANTDHTDAHGCAVYPTHWMPLPQPPATREMK